MVYNDNTISKYIKTERNIMKNKLVLLLTATMLVLSLTACGGKDSGNKAGEAAGNEATGDAQEGADATATVEVADSADVLNKVWDTFAEDQKFAAMGGDFNTPVDGAAGLFNIEDVENLSFMLYIPVDNVAMIDEAASLMHAMNANTFTGGAFHLTDAANAETLTTALKDNIMSTQWMCGFPDKLMIFTVNGEYVVSAFGNAEIMENFKTGLMEVYGDAAELVVEENIA